jgi:hypothetical protein
MIEDLLAAALRERPAPMPPRGEWDAFAQAARDHGVLPLVHAAGVASRWDAELVAAMRPSAAAEAALAILNERELRRILETLASHGVTPLLIKGAHLAYTVYPSPDYRPRLDSDLLIGARDRETVARSLIADGYQPMAHVTGDVAFGQMQYERTDASGAAHTLDVHWRIANPQAFADRLTYDELKRFAEPVSRLGPHAFAPSAPYALAIACVHRTAHHGTADRLLWLYDIHLLASACTERDWETLCRLALDRGLAPVVSAGLDDAASCLATVVPPAILARLNEGAASTDPDVLAFLASPPSRIDVVRSDWRRLRGWHQRARFLREHLFPPPDYMRRRYGLTSNAALPFVYAHRIVAGAKKWL